jgi:Bacterial Ig-like domain (group 2)/Right handed beta helix region/Protein of unknown function (DUF1565)
MHSHNWQARPAVPQRWSRWLVAVSAVALIVGTGCEVARSVGASAPVDASRIEVTPRSAAVPPNGAITFTAIAFSASGDTAPGTVTWSVSGALSLTDSSTTGGRHLGRVKAGTDTGSFRVVAHMHPGNKADTATVTVTTNPVASIVVVPTDATLAVGETTQLQVTVRDSSGAVITGRPVTWSSADGQIATVSAAGLVGGIAGGSTIITATCEGKAARATVTVTGSSPPPPPPPTGGCPGAWPAAVYPRMPLSTGQVFYVSSSSGNDANPGTQAAPWKTLQKAFDALQPGQIAYLRAGTYGALCSASTFDRAGTLAAPITVQGYPGERAVLQGQVRLEGAYLRLANVVVEGPSCGTWGAASQQGENLVLMVPGSSHHLEVSNSEIYHGGWHAGIAAGGDDIWILNNYIHDNGGFNDPGQENTSHGIYYHDGTRGVVANNILEHNRAKGLSARFSANHILVLNNTVVGNGRSGMDIAENTHDWLFANNIVVNNGNVNGGVGINTGGSSGGTSNVEIHNVFWNNGTSGSSNWNTNATIENNVVGDPGLVNPATSVPSTSHQAYSNDYHLRSGSLAIGFAASAYALPFDLAGVCRPVGAGPDAGAYEQ